MRRREPLERDDYPTDLLLGSMDDDQLLQHMGVPQKYWGFSQMIDVGGFNPTIDYWLDHLGSVYRPRIGDQHPELFGKGLIFHGAARKHKTTFAVALLLHLVRLGVRNVDPSGINSWNALCMGRFEDWQELSELFRDAASDEDAALRSKEVRLALTGEGPYDRRGDFLVLDDLSRERGTQFNVGMLTRIIRSRSDWGYPTIITLNTPPDQWESVYQSEALSAFLHDEFLAVEFK